MSPNYKIIFVNLSLHYGDKKTNDKLTATVILAICSIVHVPIYILVIESKVQ